MSDDHDKESKTEEASDKKISDAIEQGNVPVSREVPVLLSLLAILTVMVFMLPQRSQQLYIMLVREFESAGAVRLENQAATTAYLLPLLQSVSVLLLPMLLILMVGGIIASLVQNPFQLNLERIMPKWSRLSITQGWSRIYGRKGAMDFIKSLFKFSGIGLILFFLLKAQLPAIVQMMVRPPQLVAGITLQVAIKLLSALVGIAVVLAVVDTVWTRLGWRRDLRMTKQEVKEEHRQAEGDPMVKVRAKALARQRSSRRMMAAVPKATMIIANPTHFAVAMRYVRSEGGAPIVLAKGSDNMALKIRKLAEEHGIAVVENKPLARALYEKAEVNAVIPAEFFKAVAEIVHYLQLRKLAPQINRT